MIWPMVEQAHLGTTRYTTLSLVVIQVPGKPIFTRPLTALPLLSAEVIIVSGKKQRNAVSSTSVYGIKRKQSLACGGSVS